METKVGESRREFLEACPPLLTGCPPADLSNASVDFERGLGMEWVRENVSKHELNTGESLGVLLQFERRVLMWLELEVEAEVQAGTTGACGHRRPRPSSAIWFSRVSSY